jgi:hypothetical protein
VDSAEPSSGTSVKLIYRNWNVRFLALKPILKGDLHPMAKIIPIREHFQHFLAELKESFWGICTDKRSGPGSSFSRPTRCGSGTAMRCGIRTSGGRAAGSRFWERLSV